MAPDGIRVRRRKGDEASYEVEVSRRFSGAPCKFHWSFCRYEDAKDCQNWLYHNPTHVQLVHAHGLLFKRRLDHDWHSDLAGVCSRHEPPLPKPPPLKKTPAHNSRGPAARGSKGSKGSKGSQGKRKAASAAAGSSPAAAVPAAAVDEHSLQLQEQAAKRPRPAVEMPSIAQAVDKSSNSSSSSQSPNSGCVASPGSRAGDTSGTLSAQQQTPAPPQHQQQQQKQPLDVQSVQPAPPASTAPRQDETMEEAPVGPSYVWSVGQVWADDQVNKHTPLGFGSFGFVEAATTSNPRCEVAVKTLTSPYPLQQQYTLLRQVERKACPSLVPIVGACAKTGGHMVLFMELLPGKTLLDFVYDMMEDKPIMRSAFFTPGGTRRGEYSCVPDSLPWDLKWQLAEAVVRAVAALHASGLVHRDLKPKNIIVDVLQDADGSWRVKGAKLIDLESVAEVGEGGVASLVGVGKSMPYAAPEVVVEPRKPAMSPAAAGSSGSWGHQEQPSQGDVPDPLAGMQLNDASRTYAADIWSLGVVLFELFTDASCSTPNRAVVAQIIATNKELPAFLAHHQDLPEPASQLLIACLARDPLHRSTAERLLGMAFFDEEVRKQVKDWDHTAQLLQSNIYIKEVKSGKVGNGV